MADEVTTDLEGPWLVAAGTPGNARFGALLQGLRERSNLSPQQLAEHAEVHVSFVRGIERGAQAPSVASAHRLLLACRSEQGRIQWVDGGPYDLLIRDPEGGEDVAFEFKARVKGQNRRHDINEAGINDNLFQIAKAISSIDGASASSLANAVRRFAIEMAGSRPGVVGSQAVYRWPGWKAQTPRPEAAEPSGDLVWHTGDEGRGPLEPADQASLGRVIRLLAAADQQTLDRVESLLLDELESPQSDS